MNRRGGKGRSDRGPRIKDEYNIDDREHSFSSNIDRSDNRENIRNYDRGSGMGDRSVPNFEKQNRQDRGGGPSVWIDRNRDRNNTGGPQSRRGTQDGGEMDTSWRSGGQGNVFCSENLNDLEVSDSASHGNASGGSYTENRPSGRGSGSRSRGGLYNDRVGNGPSGNQNFDGSSRSIVSGTMPIDKHNDRQTSRHRIDNFVDNGDNPKRIGGNNRGIDLNSSINDYRTSSDSKEGFNAKEIFEWMSQRHNAVIEAFKELNESKRNGTHSSANDIKMYVPTERCWSQPPIIPSKDDFLQQLERAINHYRAHPTPYTGPTPYVSNDVARASQSRMQSSMNVTQRPQNIIPQPGGITSEPAGNLHGNPQFVQVALSNSQRHAIDTSVNPFHQQQQQQPQMVPNFPQQQIPSQFVLPQDVVQLNQQGAHAGLLPGGLAPTMPPQMLQQYIFQQQLMNTQFQLQSVQIPMGIPLQSNFITAPHPPPTPTLMGHQQIVSPSIGQHMQQFHIPINGHIQGGFACSNVEHLQSPTSGIVNLGTTHSTISNTTALNGTNSFLQNSLYASPKQQASQIRERGANNFESGASTESLGIFREDGGNAGSVLTNRQRQDKLISSKGQDQDKNNRMSQQRVCDRRIQERDGPNNDTGTGIQRGAWSRQNSKDVTQRGGAGVKDRNVICDSDRLSNAQVNERGLNKRLDSNMSNNNRQIGTEQEGIVDTTTNASSHLGTAPLSCAGKGQRKERNFANDRESTLNKSENIEKSGTEKDYTVVTICDKEVSRTDRGADNNRRGSRNFRNTAKSNETEMINNESIEETGKVGNERIVKTNTNMSGNVSLYQKVSGGRVDRDNKGGNRGPVDNDNHNDNAVSGEWR